MRARGARSGFALVNNQGDLGKALQELGSSGNIRSLLTSMVSAGLVTGAVNLAGLDKTLPASATTLEKVSQDLQRGLVTATVKASVQAAIQGGRFDETLVSALRLEGATVLGNAVATEIGSAYHAGDLPKAAQLIAHAALGCAEGAIASGDCGAGAIGGVAGEVAAEVYATRLGGFLLDAQSKGQLTPDNAAALANLFTQQGVNTAKLVAGLASALAGHDVDTAANAGGVAAEKNAGPLILLAAYEGIELLMAAAAAWGTAKTIEQMSKGKKAAIDSYPDAIAALNQCGSDAACRQTVKNTYLDTLKNEMDDGKTPGIGHNGGPKLDDPSTGGPKDPKDKPPVVPPPVPGMNIDYDKISTAKDGQRTTPANLSEQLLWEQVVKNPAEGKPLDGLNDDARFPTSNGWQKMEVTQKLLNGVKISIHYQYNSLTGKAYDIKLTGP